MIETLKLNREVESKGLSRLDKTRLKKMFSLIPECETLLDLGCKSGEITALYRDYAKRVVGVDFVEEFVLEADYNFPGIEFYYGDATNLQLDDKFDVIVAGELIEHVIDVFLS